jgi:ankyrin repeat protein
VNAKGVNGETPLHNAANKGPVELIELLIANGADVNSLDKQGRTPVDNTFCCGGADTEITRLLRKFGGNKAAGESAQAK